MVEPRDRRIPIMFSEEELAEIDEWRHDNRIATRADAVRRLCKVALFVDQELETIVDTASDGVAVLSEQNQELSHAIRMIMNKSTVGMTFDRDQIWDVLRVASEHEDVASEGLQTIQATLVTMYNAIAALIEAKTIKTARRKYKEVIDKANATFEEAEAKKAEREAQYEENRYLGLVFHAESSAARDAYDLMSEEEQDAYLDQRIAELRSEEAENPVTFAERYGIDDRKFWQKSEWSELLEKQQEKDLGK